jgi:hypothetical protein
MKVAQPHAGNTTQSGARGRRGTTYNNQFHASNLPSYI